jgi:hypothetical protein
MRRNPNQQQKPEKPMKKKTRKDFDVSGLLTENALVLTYSASTILSEYP